MNPPPIPDQPELFCMDCGKFWPRAFIVSARWIRNGRQAIYRCRGCQEAMERRTRPPRPPAGEGPGERADGG